MKTEPLGNMAAEMRKAFGRCPKCGNKDVITGRWFKWCKDRTCDERWVK